jgi:phospholipid/cholesterol/gamma-HCH transport system ATP-binding protein
MTNSSPPLLQFKQVTVESSGKYDSGIWDIEFALAAGDLMLVLLEKERRHLPLVDAAEGLAWPAQGSVLFEGEDWRGMSADRAASVRGNIGRVFEDGGWVNDLDVDQNISLAQQHHTHRPAEEIENEAAKLARMFGLPGLPRGRPAKLRRQDLRKAACVRAFLGQPRLLLLENPTREIYVDSMTPLVNLVRGARQRGAAVLWTTDEMEVWNDSGLRATWRGEMFGSQMHLKEAPARAS